MQNTEEKTTKVITKGSIVIIDGKEYELQGNAVLVEPITELVQGNRYLIKHSGNFCHVYGNCDRLHFMSNEIPTYFVGCFSLPHYGERFIFFDENGSYFMFTNVTNTVCSKFDFIVKQLD